MKKEQVINRAIIMRRQRKLDWKAVYVWLILVLGSIYFGIGFLIRVFRMCLS